MTQVTAPGAAVTLNSMGLWLPQVAASIIRPTLSWSTVALDAATEKFAMLGKITLAGRAAGGTKTISSSGGKIHADLGTVTWANGSTSMDVGIQDLTGANPDGTFDVKGTVVPGVETLTANAVNTFTMETGSKTITHNQSIAVVWDMTARAGADVVNIGCTIGPSSIGTPYCKVDTTGSYAAVARFPNVLIEFDDGTFGWFSPYLFRTNSVTTNAFQVGTGTADEYGSRFTLPWACSIEGISLPLAFAGSGSHFFLNIYSDITGSPSVVVQKNTDALEMGNTSTSDGWMTVNFDTPCACDAGTVYGWSVRPTSANTVTLTNYTYGSNAQMASLGMGKEAYRMKRLDNTGAFTLEDTIHVPHILHLSAFSDGASSGGGGPLISGRLVT